MRRGSDVANSHLAAGGHERAQAENAAAMRLVACRRGGVVATILGPWECDLMGFRAVMEVAHAMGHRLGMGEAVSRVRAVTDGQRRWRQRETDRREGA